ncbi:Galactose-1-phosphate uridylyltransferase [Halotydeus destructor]|nr:Galactose-1-phosphate uridylyltransferase [Halotydeus destructor]
MAASSTPQDKPHVRFNPLKGEWVLVSPHRTQRPWSGQVEKSLTVELPDHDPKNPLCPGSVRSNGHVTPVYTSTYVFDNDFPALLDDDDEDGPDLNVLEQSNSLFVSSLVKGKCRVICFHPKLNVTMPLMTISELVSVIDTWTLEARQLGAKYDWVQIFENRGEVMGCSNPHPHGQVWASNFLPNEIRRKDETQRSYFEKYGLNMLEEYVKQEVKLYKSHPDKSRVVVDTDQWLVVVPYWAVWPYETMLLPKEPLRRITDIKTDEQKEALAAILKLLTTKYDNLFETNFPYSWGWHGAPTGKLVDHHCDHWLLHGLFYPPLLRSATVKKFMVGYEMLAQAQRDLTAEQAAANLRRQSDVHYKLQSS